MIETDDTLNFDFRFFKTKERKLFNYNEHALRDEFLEYIKDIPADDDEEEDEEEE